MVKKVCVLIVLASLVNACGSVTPVSPTIDVAAVHTAAAETVIAEFTQTAQAVPPTPAATATLTLTVTPETVTQPVAETATVDPNAFLEPSPTEITCDDAIHVADVTVPDGTEMTPGQDFVKTWIIRNIGSCTWGTGYSALFAYGEKMEGAAEPITTAVAPGEEIEISVRFKAPINPGQYSSTWRMANARNTFFGQNFFALIVVR